MPIEQVKRNDLEKLGEIAEITLRVSVVLPSNVLEDLIAHTKKNISLFVEREDCAFLKYENNTKITAFILIKEYWNLSDLFVLPEYQSSGIGSALLLEGLAICKRHSAKQCVRLNSSLNAIKFYKKHGFCESNHTPAKGEYSVPLECDL